MSGEMKGKPVSESRTSMTQLVLPNDSNTHGNILGGRVMHLIDLAGAMAAFRHCRKPVVTASVDSLIFLNPIRVGHLVLLEAAVTRVFRTSMEVEVQVWSEEPYTGKQKRTSTAFLTFVALTEDGQPCPHVPQVIPKTAEEQQEFEEALVRRQRRLERAGRKRR